MNLLHVRHKQEVSRYLTSVYFDSKLCKLKVEKVINGRVQTVNSKEDLYLLIKVGYYYERQLRDNLSLRESLKERLIEPKSLMCNA